LEMGFWTEKIKVWRGGGVERVATSKQIKAGGPQGN